MAFQALISFLLCSTLILTDAAAEKMKAMFHPTLSKFENVKAASSANGALHLIVDNFEDSRTYGFKLPINKESVDNIKGTFKINMTSLEGTDINWLQWLKRRFSKPDIKGNFRRPKLAFAMLNTSESSLGALVRLEDGQQLCSTFSVSVLEGDGKDDSVEMSCGLKEGETVVGSIGSGGQEPMFIFVEAGKNVELRIAKDNNFLSPDAKSYQVFLLLSQSNNSLLITNDTSEAVKNEKYVLSKGNLLFGFTFSDTVHLWLRHSQTDGEVQESLVLLFDDPREKLRQEGRAKVDLKAVVPASDYFECFSLKESTPETSQKIVYYFLVAGVLLFVFAILVVFFVVRARRSKKSSGLSVDQKRRSSTLSNAFASDKEEKSSRSLRQGAAIGTLSSTSSSSTSSTTAKTQSLKRGTSKVKNRSQAVLSSNRGKQWQLSLKDNKSSKK